VWYKIRKRMTGKNFIRIQAEIVNGKCPTCHEMTILVGITPEMYRCINCGADLHQHINGKISYIPSLSSRTLMSDIESYFNGEEI
jgi:ribosomal protein S27E